MNPIFLARVFGRRRVVYTGPRGGNFVLIGGVKRVIPSGCVGGKEYATGDKKTDKNKKNVSGG